MVEDAKMMSQLSGRIAEMTLKMAVEALSPQKILMIGKTEMTLKMAVVALSPQKILMIGKTEMTLKMAVVGPQKMIFLIGKTATAWCNFCPFLQTSLSAQSMPTTGNMVGASMPTRRAKYKRYILAPFIIP
jgi:hypothetical protein